MVSKNDIRVNMQVGDRLSINKAYRFCIAGIFFYLFLILQNEFNVKNTSKSVFGINSLFTGEQHYRSSAGDIDQSRSSRQDLPSPSARRADVSLPRATDPVMSRSRLLHLASATAAAGSRPRSQVATVAAVGRICTGASGRGQPRIHAALAAATRSGHHRCHADPRGGRGSVTATQRPTTRIR